MLNGSLDFLECLLKHRNESMGGSSHVGFLGEFDLSEFLSLGHHVLVLNSHNTTTLLSLEVGVIVELRHEGLLESIEIGKILLLDVGEGDASGGLGVAELSESSLGLDEAEWDSLLSAESREEDHNLSWVNIMGHDDELGFTLLDEVGNVVKTELKNVWLITTGLSFLLGSLLESFLLLLSGLWGILGEELEELGSLVLVNGLLELEKGSRGLQSHEQNSLLSLDSDVLWPLDESGEVLLWLDGSTDSEGSWALLEKRISLWGFTGSGTGNDLLLSDFLCLLGPSSPATHQHQCLLAHRL